MPKTLRSKPTGRHILLCLLFAACLSQIGSSQAPLSGGKAKDILLLSESEQTEFVKSTMDRGFPDAEGDKFSLLLVNRSALVIPLIESKLEKELASSPQSERFVDLASAMIAYAGDEESLKALSKLTKLDEKRFSPFLSRTLDHSMNWRNPFTLAYRALELGEPAVNRETLTWVESGVESVRMQRLWAESLLDRYGKAPDDAQWARDPIASRLKAETLSGLKQTVKEYMAQAQKTRQQQ